MEGTRLSTEHVWANCAGSDSDDHIKMYRESWPHATPDAIRQALAFERKRRGIAA